MVYFVSADIGGTNSRFSLHRATNLSAGQSDLVYRESFRNDNFDDFISVVRKFLSNSKCETCPEAMCLAIAGPVEDDCAELTNRAWKLSGRVMERELGIASVHLINDFVGTGYGLLSLKEGAYTTMYKGDHRAGGPVMCVGAGTGLGECYLTADTQGDYTAWPGEGGHVEFAPRDTLEFELLQFLQRKFKGRVSVERVVSGIGFTHIYEFLKERFPRRVDHSADREISAAEDTGAAISKRGLEDPDSLCGLAVTLFLSAYGSEVGNCALKFLPRGGLYIAGGIAKHMLDRITDPDDVFLKAYHDKGRLSYVLDLIPLHVVTCDSVGQGGAHYVAIRTLCKKKNISHASSHDNTSGRQGPNGGLPSLASIGFICSVAALLGAAHHFV